MISAKVREINQLRLPFQSWRTLETFPSHELHLFCNQSLKTILLQIQLESYSLPQSSVDKKVAINLYIIKYITYVHKTHLHNYREWDNVLTFMVSGNVNRFSGFGDDSCSMLYPFRILYRDSIFTLVLSSDINFSALVLLCIIEKNIIQPYSIYIYR